MLKKVRKSSGRVTLVLIGLAALSGCRSAEEDPGLKRDVYASREDCLADWGNKPTDCTPATDERHRSHGYVYGPSYHIGSPTSANGWAGDGKRPGSHSLSSTGGSYSSHQSSSARGGFGSTGHSSSG